MNPRLYLFDSQRESLFPLFPFVPQGILPSLKGSTIHHNKKRLHTLIFPYISDIKKLIVIFSYHDKILMFAFHFILLLT